MNNEIKETVERFENNPLYEKTILLNLGGSYAYGTNVEGSDVDLRGIALNTRRDVLLNKDFEQYIDKKTDTVIYSLNKIFGLLTKCNPNIIEMLGCRDEEYIKIAPAGKKIIDNKRIFLSKSAYYTFSGYATAQMKRLNKCVDYEIADPHRNDSIRYAIENSLYNVLHESNLDRDILNEIQVELPDYTSNEEDLLTDTKIKLESYRDVKSIYSVVGSVYNTLYNFSKGSHHNSEAEKYNKMNKHMLHLLRLYMMVIDILKDGEITTYREKEHDLLMSIRDGEYLENGEIKKEFFKIVDDYKKKVDVALENSKLPDRADKNKIDDLLLDIYSEEYGF